MKSLFLIGKWKTVVLGGYSPAIAYSPRYAPGYPALSGLINKARCHFAPSAWHNAIKT